MIIVRLLVLVSLTAMVWGCGQKGPLVLPDAQHSHKKVKLPALPKPPAVPASAPASPAPAPAPAAPMPNTASPEGGPDGNSTPNPAPQR
jgi:predicted small lipoprotein YifL